MSKNIFTKLWDIIQDILPILKSAAEKSFEKLPKEKQEEAIAISKMVEVIKQGIKEEAIPAVVLTNIQQLTGFDEATITKYFQDYLAQKGISVTTFAEALLAITSDAATRTETGLKSLWSDVSNTISSVVAGIDWQLLLMGIGEFVYREFVKGKVKL